MKRLAIVAAVVAGASLLLAASAPAASSGAWGCQANGLSGTVLDQPVAGIPAGSPGACRSDNGSLVDTSTLGLPVAVDAVTSITRLTGSGSARDQQAAAIGGVTNLRVAALPELPIDEILATVPQISIPTSALALLVPGLPASLDIDLRPAVAALLPGGKLPNVELLRIGAVTAYALASCKDSQPAMAGASQIADVTVLGQSLQLDGTTEQVLNLLNTESIDLSDLDLTKLQLPLGLSLDLPLVGPILTNLIRSALDALPPLAIPAQLARVKLTPGAQAKTAERLTQTALRIEVSLLGRSLVDLHVGAASVAQDGVACAAGDAPATGEDLLLGCSKRDLVLIDVLPDGSRVKLLGAADRRFAGRTVDIRFLGTGAVVARPTVRPDGSFSATAPLPARRLRSTNRARYQASIGRERSLDLKLERRMRVTSLRAQDGTVTISGRVVAPLAARAGDRTVTLQRRVSCRKVETVARVMPDADGTFRIAVAAPKDATAAVYRLRTKVRRTTRNAKLFDTFTLPRAVDLTSPQART